MRTTKSVAGVEGLVLMLPKMATSSVWNMRTKTDVLGMKRLVLKLPEVITSSV
tara:strand:- start:177 stop:335 length:159 start_codon:yes stop_codon:yes gene_type:complete